MHEAKTKLSQLIRAMEAGEQVIINRAGKPVAQLVPVNAEAKPFTRQLGTMKGKLWHTEDAFDPLPDAFWQYDESIEPK